MPWGSTGRALPSDWKRRTAAVKARDGHRCTWVRADDTRCTETTRLEVDHIADPGDHSLSNLRTLCHWHHAKRTALQSAASQQASKQAAVSARRAAHPGMAT